MKKITLTILALIFGITLNAQTTKWNFDNAHTKIGFSVTHMMITDVEGQFNKFNGTVTSDKPDFTDAKINFNIDVSSINTDNADRDKHLRSADFFDVEKFPNIKFEGVSFKKTGKGKYKLSGKFTMLGVTKNVTFDAKFSGTVKDPWGNTRAGFKINGKINRNDWGLKYNSPMDAGGVLIGNEVEIICNVELIKEK
ncbi:polyisoprenoid-binding protein [Bacteroidetes/Chlorobi group bacterium ChocPot_Mid]|nr:MAG: polyisoprenoid-binding protein [Bacteroidetes/Chlorobi group bacterium ChocPot_Mid]